MTPYILHALAILILIVHIILKIIVEKTSGNWNIAEAIYFFGFNVLAIPTLLAIIIYFGYTKQPTHALVSGVVLGIIVIPIIYSHALEWKQKHDFEVTRTAWLERVENLEFVSEKSGISFSHVSENISGLPVQIEESDSDISIFLGEYLLGKILVFSKERDVSLIEHLENTYRTAEHPDCEFYSEPTETSGQIVKYQDDWLCPSIELPEEKENWEVHSRFMAFPEQPDTYIFIGLLRDSLYSGSESINAYKEGVEKWHETITIISE